MKISSLRLRPSQLVFWPIIACVLCPMANPANADIIHRPHFKIEGMVVVWGGSADQLSRPRAASGKQTLAFETAMPAITSKLIPLPSSQVHNKPVPLRDILIGTTAFYVASNSGFSIDAQLAASSEVSQSDLANTEFTMSAHLGSAENPAIGQKAQYAHSGGREAGFTGHVQTLADLSNRRTVFRGNQRTAIARGTIAEQSVRFETRYRARQNASFTQLPSVIFTVFVP